MSGLLDPPPLLAGDDPQNVDSRQIDVDRAAEEGGAQEGGGAGEEGAGEGGHRRGEGQGRERQGDVNYSCLVHELCVCPSHPSMALLWVLIWCKKTIMA